MSKDTLGIVSLRPKMMDMYPHPLGTYDSLRKNFVKMGVFPQMRTLVDCACWVHILGVGRGVNWLTYQAIITSKYHRLTLPQTEVAHLYNWRYQFSWILAPFLWSSVSFLLWDVKSWKNVFLNVPYGCIYSMYTLNLNMAEKFGKFRMFFIPLSCPSEKNWRKYNRLNWCKNSDFGSFWGKWPEKGDL